jgi:3-deoxy-D-manno-octulosonic-acid transferase
MRALYTFSMYVLGGIIHVLSLFGHKKSSLWIEERKKHPFTEYSISNKRIIWFHFSSAGEYEQGIPVFNALKKAYPNHQFLISFFSPSGYIHKKKYHREDWLVYLPLDTAINARTFIQHYKPEIAIFNKYEFWFNHLVEAKRQGTKLILINGIFRSTQYYFKWFGKWSLNRISAFDQLFVQDQNTKNLLQKVGIHQVTITGDTRFNRAFENTLLAQENLQSLGIEKSKDKVCIVAGSTWETDEMLLYQFFLNPAFRDKIQLFIAPHEHLEIEENEHFIRLSQIENIAQAKGKIVIIDRFGILKYLYQIADIAYLGGGFNKGIHNIIEASIYGIPTLFGPYYYKFKEAHDLIKLGGAFSFEDEKGFNKILSSLIQEEEQRQDAGKKAKSYTSVQLQATDEIIKSLRKINLIS